jgi:glycosyltransferase involved in cell wall biosynthesis
MSAARRRHFSPSAGGTAVPHEPQSLMVRRLRILIVLEAASAGAGQHVLTLAQGLLEHGHDVHLAWSILRSEVRFIAQLHELERRGLRAVQVLMRPEPGMLDLGALISVRHYLRHAGPFDIVHGHSSKGGFVARVAASLTGAARFYTPHAFKTMDPKLSRKAKWLYGGVECILGRYVTEAIVLSSQGEAAHARRLGLPRRRLSIIPNAVRIPPDLPDRATARRSFDLPAACPVLAWIGRLSPQKAPERFVAMMARLHEAVPEARALMLGYGELEASVCEQFRARGLEEVCRLHTGRRGWDALAAADLCVLTSRYEGMPLVLLEAQALNVPAVATDVGGVREILAGDPRSSIVPNDDAVDPLLEATVAGVRSIESRPRPQIAEAAAVFTFIQSHLALYAQMLPRQWPASLATGLPKPSSSLLPMHPIGEGLVLGPRQPS